jgi:hypothetical protein
MTYRIWVDTPLMPGNFRPETTFQKNNLYLGNKMVGKESLNHAWFDSAAASLLALPTVGAVFNPAQHDRNLGFDPEGFNGSFEELEDAGFDRRAALTYDWNWIGLNSDAMIVGPDWANSPGAISEIAAHQALFLPVWEFGVFINYWFRDILFEYVMPPILELGKPVTGRLSPARLSYLTELNNGRN